MDNNKYKTLVDRHTPKENRLYNALIAFVIGGIMGLIGQGLVDIYSYFLDISTSDASVLMIVTLVFIGCLLTCLGFLIKWLISLNAV